MGVLIRGISQELNALFFAIDATDIVENAREIHQLSHTATAALGRLLIASSLLGVGLKENKHKLTLRVIGNGPLGYLLANSDRSGNVRGYVQHGQVELPLNDQGKLSVGQAVGEGSLYVIKDLGMKEPYVGISQLVSGEIGDDITHYLFHSEQVQSLVALGVYLEQGKVVSAGGVLVQLLPGSSEQFIEKLEEKLKEFKSITSELQKHKNIEVVVKNLFEGVEPIEVTDVSTVNYRCDCHRDRFYRGLMMLGKEDLEEIFKQESVAKAECQFCGKEYHFTRDEFSEILGG